MTGFRPCEPDQQLLLPPSLRDWLPPDHLAWFIAGTVDQLDLSELPAAYRDGGQGNLPYHPAMMLKILIDACATGVFSSRRMARRIEESIAFRVLAAGHAPDHRTICRFREQHLAAFERLFVQVVQIARDAGLVRMGTLAIDGSKIRANASKPGKPKRMAKTLRSKRGRRKYERRKHLAEPPFGWIKQGLGFRQFSLRGLSKVTGEFTLVCLALNLRRMATMIRWA
jgi:transposase